MMRRLLVVIIPFTRILLFSSSVYAQTSPLKWGKVSADEIALTRCAFDSAATAVVLRDYGQVTFAYGSHVVIERHVRIKILHRNAIDAQANVVIPYYVEDDLEKITSLKAQTIHVEPTGKPTVQEVKSDQIFDAVRDAKWREKRFTFPAVSEGSIIEYKYTTLSTNVTFLEGWTFQHDIPTLHSEFKALIGEGLDYRILYQGRRLLDTYGKENANRNQWMLRDVPALVDEPFTANYLDYAEKIRFQLAGYYKRGNDIGGSPQYTSTLTTWDKLASELLSHTSYTNYLNRQGTARTVLDQLKLTPGDTAGNVQKIYQYVSRTFTWNEKHRLFPEQNFPAFFETRQGNSAEINLFLTLLLQEARLEADPVILSTRANGKIQSTYPFLAQFNHVIASVRLAGSDHLLDATNPLRSHKLLAIADMNGVGFRMNKKQSRWLEIKPPAASKQVVSVKADLTKPEQASYRIDVSYDNHLALEKRLLYAKQGKEAFAKDQMTVHLTDCALQNFSSADPDVPEKPFTTSYAYSAANALPFGDKILYFSPVLVNAFPENPFKTDSRYLPVEFDYPVNYTYVLNVQLPDGYAVQEMPKNALLQMPNGYADFRYSVTPVTPQQIQVVTTVNRKSTLVPSEYYPHLKEFYDQIAAKYREHIVLQKK